MACKVSPTAIICGNFPESKGFSTIPFCAYCQKRHTKLCDAPVGDEGDTCDLPMCKEHSFSPHKGVDLCRAHATVKIQED